MKNLYCAQCGQELYLIRKASRSQGIIFDMVKPHECPPNVVFKLTENIIPKDKKSPKELNELFDSFKFVKKLNNLDKKLEIEPTDSNHLTDNRPEEFVKDPTVSLAPPNLLNSLQASTTPKQKPPKLSGGQSLEDSDE